MVASTRRALVTGGTGSIGSAIVRLLSRRGIAEVWFQYLSDETAAGNLEGETGAKGFRLDLAQPFTLPRCDFHILVNAAGILLTKTLTHEVTDDEISRTINVNLLAPFRLCKQCIPYMMERGYGRIVNIGSIYSERGCTENSSYNVSKHGLSGLTRSLAKEYASFGIAVNQIDPSAVESEMMNRIAASNVERGRATSVAAYLAAVRAAVPVGRMPTPDDVAEGAVFLIEQSGFVNGTLLPIDGGQIC